jgi:hypothetical protein
MYLNTGNSGFESVRKGKYIDKSELIAYINSTIGTKEKLTCVSRPRRFGKSYAAQMLAAYYDRTCDSRALFSDLKIAKDNTFEKHLNKYDVIFLDMTIFINTVKDINDTVSYMESQILGELKATYDFISGETVLLNALSKICDYTKKKFIVIIDEWDAVFREAKDNETLQKEYVSLLRSLFRGNQTDKIFEAAYITGILPIKKYGTQSAMSDFYEYTMIEPEPLAKYIGFTEDEVQSLCKDSNLNFEEIKKWYDGYTMGDNLHIYNPKSVLDAIKRGKIQSYWTKTETYESLKLYIDLDFDGLREALIGMIGGAKIKIDTNSFQNDMTSMGNKDDVLTLLVHLGYLGFDFDTSSVYIPNNEIQHEFIRAVKNGKRSELVGLINESDELLQATINKDCDTVARIIEKVHDISTTPLYYNNEQALRSVIRFAFISYIDNYTEIQELPSGKGYADIVYIPRKNS